MQLSFRQKEQLFHELAQLARSGIPLQAALENVANAGHAIGRSARKVKEIWALGGSAAEAFRAAGFEARDAAVLEAGEKSGRLEEVFGGLSDYYAQLAAARHAMITRSLYPLFVLHFGVLALAAPKLVSQGFGAFIAAILPELIVFYIVLGGFLIGGYLMIRASAKTAGCSQILLAIPFFGKFYRDWTAWNFSLVLSLYIRAGGSLLSAFDAAAHSCANALMKARSLQAIDEVRTKGATLAEPFRRLRAAPSLLIRSIEIGEQSGRLDEESARAAALFKTAVMQKLDLFSEWLPRLLYVFILILMGWQAVEMFAETQATLNGVLDSGSQ